MMGIIPLDRCDFVFNLFTLLLNTVHENNSISQIAYGCDLFIRIAISVHNLSSVVMFL